MAMTAEFRAPADPAALRYVRAPRPVHFPTDELVPESRRHLEIRTALYQLLTAAFGQTAAIGSEQFVYWDPTDPRACLAPDVMVRLGTINQDFSSWKVWERGAPHVAIEIISRSDARDEDWKRKLELYRRLGVLELLRFDPGAQPNERLHIWESRDGDLVERVLDGTPAPSCCLPGFWVTLVDESERPVLRLARDAEGRDLYPTLLEAERAAKEAERAAKEAERAAKEAEQAAQRRIQELEAEVEKLRRT
jgi:Uma2 family endonuclease